MGIMAKLVARVGMLAETTVSTELGTFIQTIKGALADFTTTNLGIILVAGLSVSVGLVIAWFAYRFITRKVSGALKKGKL